MGIPPSAFLSLACRSLTSRLPPRRPPRESAPPAELRLRGLDAEVWICRDGHGIPRIYAGDEADAFFALGFVMLQDRWWQMDLWRRTASGRLAEIFGDRPLGRGAPSGQTAGLRMAGADLFHRAVGLRRLAEADLEVHGPEGRGLLGAFTAGANAARDAAIAAGRYPAECVLLRRLPEPWTEVDSLCCARLIAWMLSLSLSCHLVIGKLREHPHLARIMPRSPEEGPTILDAGASPWEEVLGLLAAAGGSGGAFGAAAPGTGSNSWAVAPGRSASGGALLANDPHLPLGLPCVWYQFYLEWPGRRLAGATLPGIAGALVGHNGRVAWGLTNTMLDDADLYAETVDLTDPARYLTPEGPRPFLTREEAIPVRGEAAPRRRIVRFTEHGGVRCPVISDVLPAGRDGRVLSLRWAGLEPWAGLDVVRGMNRARTAEEFGGALRGYAVPAQNFLVADADGTIAYYCGGRIPRRPALNPGGALDGASGRHEWQGTFPFDENPRAANPPCGFLVTANHRVTASGPAGTLPLFSEPAYRAARIRQRVRAQARHTPESFAAIQADAVSVQARALVAGILRPLAGGFGHAKARAAAARLLAWDGTMGAASPAAALFHAWYAHLLRRVIRPPLEAAAPGLFDAYFSVLHLAVHAADAVLLAEDPAWYPEGKAPAVEAALAAAVEELEAAQGPDPAGWRWGAAHALTLAHPLGAVGHPLGRLLARWLRLNRGPFPQPGDGMTVNLSAYTLAAPYRPLVGPSLRVIVDLKDPEASRWVIPGGSSGDPLSPHYADQVDLWRRGDYLSMRFLPLEAARRAGPALRLVPA
jgi:penicillin amidase